MALKPIPLTTDPNDEDSPSGAIPVEIHGGGVGERGPEGPRGPAGEDGSNGADGADGFPSESDWNALVARVEALEEA